MRSIVALLDWMTDCTNASLSATAGEITKGIEVGLSHGARNVVQREGEVEPMVQHVRHIGKPIRIERNRGDLPVSPSQLETRRSSGFERIDDMQIMGESLGEVPPMDGWRHRR